MQETENIPQNSSGSGSMELC